MAASRARLEALLARVQKRASEPRAPSSAAAPILEAVRGGASRSPADASADVTASRTAAADAPASVRVTAARAIATSAVLAHGAAPQNEIGDDDIEEYDDELIEIIDDAEVIPQAVAVARAIEPAAFGAAVDRRPSAPIRSEPVPARPSPARPSPEAQRPEAQRPEALRPEAVAARPIAASEVARARSQRRELRHTAFTELLDASLKLG
jgi:hypothetical protein